jgi:hypothetical protein
MRRLVMTSRWPLFLVGCSLLVAPGMLSTREIFYVRDLSSYFWPEHLWLRECLLSGESPFWDPYIALGQPAIADPVRQIQFLPTLLLRLVPSAELGFNLIVGLPLPVAALGTYGMLRSRVSAQAATFGACAYALAGPFVSTLNTPNLSWAAALLPFALWSATRFSSRPSPVNFAGVAFTVGLIALAGEAVVLLVALVLLPVWGLCSRGRDRTLAVTALTVSAVGSGLALSAAQLLPLARATSLGFRGSGLVADAWPLPAAGLVELLVPGAFGDPMAMLEDESPWLIGLGGGEPPLLLSVYIGAPVLILAIVGTTHHHRRLAFSAAVATVLLVLLALGDATPLYPLLRALPGLASTRFPSKYLVPANLLIAYLAAAGYHALGGALDDSRTPARVVTTASACLVVLCAVAWLLLSAGAIEPWLESLGRDLAIRDAGGASTMLADRLFWRLPWPAVLAVLTAAAAWVTPASRWALPALVIMTPADFLLANGALNPTADVAAFAKPAWVAAIPERSGERVFLPGRLPGGEAAVSPVRSPALLSRFGLTAALNSELASFPATWRLREAVSTDLTFLFTREYWVWLVRLRALSPPERIWALRRASVRYFMLRNEPLDGRLMAEVAAFAPLSLYELDGTLPRVEVLPYVEVVPDPNAQLEALLDPAFDAEHRALVSSWPAENAPPKGPSTATIQVEDSTHQVISVDGSGGCLIVRDSYDPGWRATVDGVEATVTRANGLFRAVRVPPGEHLVEFEFSSRELRLGTIVSLFTSLALLVAVLARPARGLLHGPSSRKDSNPCQVRNEMR